MFTISKDRLAPSRSAAAVTGATIAAAFALTSLFGPATASADHVKADKPNTHGTLSDDKGPPCAPSRFHNVKTTYRGLHTVSQANAEFGQDLPNAFNSEKKPIQASIAITKSQTKTWTVSSQSEVDASVLFGSVKQSLGMSMSKSASTTAGITLGPAQVPPGYYLYAQPLVNVAKVAGTVTQVDTICNAQLYEGPITVTAPVDGATWTLKTSRAHPV
jgi:hypothetical protein